MTGKQQAEAVENALRGIRSRCVERSYVGVTNELISHYCTKYGASEAHVRTVGGIPKRCRK